MEACPEHVDTGNDKHLVWTLVDHYDTTDFWKTFIITPLFAIFKTKIENQNDMILLRMN